MIFSEILSFYFLVQHVDIVVPYIHNADVRHVGRRVVFILIPAYHQSEFRDFVKLYKWHGNL